MTGSGRTVRGKRNEGRDLATAGTGDRLLSVSPVHPNILRLRFWFPLFLAGEVTPLVSRGPAVLLVFHPLDETSPVLVRQTNTPSTIDLESGNPIPVTKR